MRFVTLALVALLALVHVELWFGKGGVPRMIELQGKLQAQQYYTLTDLPQLPPVPQGFKVQLSTDGTTYVLSLKDAQDPCGFAYFSDQDGVIYTATPAPVAP